MLVVEKQPASRRTPGTSMSGGIGADAFGRPAESLIPLDQPPYYCMPLYPGGSNTCGGPRRDEHARILNPFGAPIPGLYGAGELGESVGLLYPANGGNLSESVCLAALPPNIRCHGDQTHTAGQAPSQSDNMSPAASCTMSRHSMPFRDADPTVLRTVSLATPKARASRILSRIPDRKPRITL